MGNTFELLCIGITALTAILALIQSSLALYKSNAPITVNLIDQPFTQVGMIGYYDDADSFVPIFVSDNDKDLNMEMCFMSLRIINPKSYPITLFNFYVSDENKRIIPYFNRLQASFLPKDLKLIAKCLDYSMGITLPYSHYITIEPGSFSHVDIIVAAKELQSCKRLYLTFRDSSKTFLKRKNKRILGGTYLNHRLHSYKFRLDAKQ
ncbi:hypothetical protein [Niameybacter massiliensis]|uniref:hypothetical protein n=1 Tax=Niameybacter massiliensis TaxID=1658108 RepID=UPI0006B4F154|nr:hypothetical protein [Niameybacter massiliensis]